MSGEVVPLRRANGKIAGIPAREKHPYCTAFCRDWFIEHFSCARESVILVDSCLNPFLYTPLVSQQLEMALNRTPGLTVRIITGPRVLTKHKANNLCGLAYDDEYESRVRLRSLSILNEQFAVIDGNFVYRELTYLIGEAPSDVEVSKWDSSLAESYSKRFEVLWNGPGACQTLFEEMKVSLSPPPTTLLARRSL